MDEEEVINEQENPQPPTVESAPKTKKETFMARIMEKYPDMDEEDAYDAYLEYLDRVDGASNAHKTLNEKLKANPKAGMMLADIMDGSHPAVAIKRNFADDMLVDESDEDNFKALLEAERERIAQDEQRTEKEQEYINNLMQSEADIEEFCNSKSITDEEFEDFIATCVEMTSDLLSGKLNKKLLSILWQGRNYESEVQMAEDRGYVKGKNEKSVIAKKERLGDGLPQIGSSSATSPKSSEKFNIPAPRKVW